MTHLLALAYVVFSSLLVLLLLNFYLIRRCRRFLQTKTVHENLVGIIRIIPPAGRHLIRALDHLRCTHRPLHRRQQDRETQLKGPPKVPLSKQLRQTRTLQQSHRKSHHPVHHHQLQTSMIPDQGHQVKQHRRVVLQNPPEQHQNITVALSRSALVHTTHLSLPPEIPVPAGHQHIPDRSHQQET
jgi:hypothetical protein